MGRCEFINEIDTLVELASIEDVEKNAHAEVEITKADEDKRLVFGWASIAVENGEQLEDIQHDMIDPEDLEEAAYEYVLNFRDTGEEHLSNFRKKGKLVESCVFTEEKQQAMGLAPGTLPVGWWIGLYIEDDDAWKRIKNGTYRMFSIEGRAERVPVVKGDTRKGCGVIVLKDDKILVGTRIERNGKGKMGGPGGHIKTGETPEQAAIRETKEEFGIDCKNLYFLGTQDNDTGYVYICTEYEGEPKTDEKEMTDPRWIDPTTIKEEDAHPPFYRSLNFILEEVTEHIGKSDRFDCIEEVEKFNPYHGPDGRFTTASGATSFTIRTRAGYQQRLADKAIAREKTRHEESEAMKVEFKPAKTKKEATTYAKNNLGFKSVNYGKMDLDVINHVNGEISKIQSKYPETKGAVHKLKFADDLPDDVVARTKLDTKTGNVSLQFNANDYGQGLDYVQSFYKNGVDAGYFPKGTNYQSVVWHEYGHVLANITRKQNAGLKPDELFPKNDVGPRITVYRDSSNHSTEKKWVDDAAKSLGIDADEVGKRISKYAGEKRSEAVAEAFSEVNTSISPRKESEAVVKASGWYRN